MLGYTLISLFVEIRPGEKWSDCITLGQDEARSVYVGFIYNFPFCLGGYSIRH